MLRRLRLKFILTNMLLVTVVLLAVFGALMISTSQQLERESAAAMKLALRQDGIPPQLELHLPDQGGAREWRWTIPVFCVTIEADGTLTLEEGSQVKVTEDTLAPGGPGDPGGPGPVRHLAESWSAVPAGAALRRTGAHRLLRPQLGAGLPGTADGQFSAHRRGGSGGVFRHQPVSGPAVPEAGGESLDPAAAVCGRRLPRAEDPSHGDSGQHRNHGRPPGRHGGLPAQVAGLHPGGGPADEGAGGGHALPGQARRGGAAQGLPHGQFQRPGHRVRAAL